MYSTGLDSSACHLTLWDFVPNQACQLYSRWAYNVHWKSNTCEKTKGNHLSVFLQQKHDTHPSPLLLTPWGPPLSSPISPAGVSQLHNLIPPLYSYNQQQSLGGGTCKSQVKHGTVLTDLCTRPLQPLQWDLRPQISPSLLPTQPQSQQCMCYPAHLCFYGKAIPHRVCAAQIWH